MLDSNKFLIYRHVMSLPVYNRKRKFHRTPEPRGKKAKGRGKLRFVVQMHDASHLHWDLRLEFDGVFKSWAIPKGPSLNPLDKRLAVFVEDHPLEYGSFEGIIPKGNYGAGTVMVWDKGTYNERSSKGRKDNEKAMKKALEKGHITIVMDGQKLKGEFALIKLKKAADEKSWLLIKTRDEYSTYKRTEVPNNISVKTGRTLEEITGQSPERPKRKKSVPLQTKKVSREPMPRKIKPMLPTMGQTDLPNLKDWLFEPAHDGLRAIAEVEGKKVHLYSKSGLPFEKKFPQIVDELKNLNLNSVFDGEIVKSKYIIFDVLYHDGKDLRKLPLRKRKEIFSKIKFKEKHVTAIKKTKTPMMIAKNLNSHYHSGTTSEWHIVQSKKKAAIPPPSAELQLTHLNKVYWPDEGYTKGDLINYYKKISRFILPYLKDRPESLNRQPGGIAAPSFYQKDMTGHIPRWLKIERIFSESADKSIDYVVCQDQRSLLYLANLGCIEINPWFSRVGNLDKPDFMVIDLDPDDNPFDQVIEIAQEIHKILEKIGAKNFCKTSGATGIHIGVPTGGRYDFDEVRKFAEAICRFVAKKYPGTTSVERNPQRRRKKIYLDFLQNRRGQTLAAPYCIRPKAKAPVSMPISWKKLKPGLLPEQFNIENASRLIPKQDSFWRGVLGKPINLDKCLLNFRKKFKL